MVLEDPSLLAFSYQEYILDEMTLKQGDERQHAFRLSVRDESTGQIDIGQGKISTGQNCPSLKSASPEKT